MPQALFLLSLDKVGRIPFSHFQPSSPWDNKNWPLQYKGVKVEKFGEQNWLERLKMVQLKCSKHLFS